MQIIYRATCPNCESEMFCVTVTSEKECLIDFEFLDAMIGFISKYQEENVCKNCGKEFYVQTELFEEETE